MSIYSLVFSPTGGTAKVAQALTSAWPECRTVDLSDNIQDYSRYIFTPEDVCFLSFPVYEGRVPKIVLDRVGAMTAGGAQMVLAAVFGNRSIDDALLEGKDAALRMGFRPVAALQAVAAHSILTSIAVGRPDEEDIAQLQEFSRRLHAALSAGGSLPLVEVPGQRPYFTANGTIIPPVANDNCISCGLCAEKCPVGAISTADLKGSDKEKCICCMRCVSICPVQARAMPPKPPMPPERAQKFAAMFAGRKPNLFYLS